MTHATDTAPPAALSSKAGEPTLTTLILIFWAAFALAAVSLRILHPELFLRMDPDSLMRLVQVRDLLAGQGWYDLVQLRMDPPSGALMHWSRLIDAPLAALVLLGNAVGVDGEAVALTAWPLLLLLAQMSGTVLAATALAGRRAALPALLLCLLFFYPLLSFLPNSIDHHSAQIAALMLTLAAAVRLREGARFGLATGIGAALMLAIGLETLPYVALLGFTAALSWAWSGQGARGTSAFGLAFAVAPAALYLLAGSPAAAMACDSLSWAYAFPAAIAGAGLIVLPRVVKRPDARVARLATLGLAGLAALAGFVLTAPECLRGPYGGLSPELKRLFLHDVQEAQPLWTAFLADPALTFASVAAPLLAVVIGLRRAASDKQGSRWLIPTLLVLTALAISLYQQRTLPFASAAAIPLLAAWIADLSAGRGIDGLRPFRRAAPVVAAFILILPVAHLAAGWLAVTALSTVSGGRLSPAARPEPSGAFQHLSAAGRECLDEPSAALLASVADGLVVAPLFYGPGVLVLSTHSVVAGPYHRAEAAILDTLAVMTAAPEDARAIVGRRAANYLAICAASPEVAMTAAEAPDGLLARLMAGESEPWLAPVGAGGPSALRLWRVVH